MTRKARRMTRPYPAGQTWAIAGGVRPYTD
jgi:hypothetical protein